MKSRLSLGSVSGIGIYLHWTFLLGLMAVFGFYLYMGASLPGALAGVAFVATVFGCVLLHELGHAFMAKQFKIDTEDITLYPIGGVARLTSMPRQPKAEFLIAVAGPAVNLFIAAVLFFINRALDIPMGLPTILEVPTEMSGILPDLLSALFLVNLALVGFNMLPAFPMDGGRVLRAGLASQMPYERATYIAATVGQVVAFLMMIAAVPTLNPGLFFVGIFVIAAARQELKHVTGG